MGIEFLEMPLDLFLFSDGRDLLGGGLGGLSGTVEITVNSGSLSGSGGASSPAEFLYTGALTDTATAFFFGLGGSGFDGTFLFVAFARRSSIFLNRSSAALTASFASANPSFSTTTTSLRLFAPRLPLALAFAATLPLGLFGFLALPTESLADTYGPLLSPGVGGLTNVFTSFTIFFTTATALRAALRCPETRPGRRAFAGGIRAKKRNNGELNRFPLCP